MSHPVESQSIVVSEWERNQREVIRVTLAEYKGSPTVDVRTFYKNAKGEFRPTPKGLTISTDHLPMLVDSFQKANLQAELSGQNNGETAD